MSKENGVPSGFEPETSWLLDRRSNRWAMEALYGGRPSESFSMLEWSEPIETGHKPELNKSTCQGIYARDHGKVMQVFI